MKPKLEVRITKLAIKHFTPQRDGTLKEEPFYRANTGGRRTRAMGAGTSPKKALENLKKNHPEIAKAFHLQLPEHGELGRTEI